MRNRLIILILPLVALLATSCTIARYVGDDEHVLHHIEMEVERTDGSSPTAAETDALRHAKDYYMQRPNSKLLGIRWLPVSKWVYCFGTTPTPNIWNNYFHRIGQAPVVYDEAQAFQTTRQLHQLLDTKGCFGSEVSFDTLSIRGRNISIRYRLRVGERRVVDEVVYTTDNADVRRLLDLWQPEAALQPGQPYDQDKLIAERTRLAANLREAGYYRATPQNISFLVDTTYSDTKLSIEVVVDSRELRVYHINNIYVFPNSNAGLADSRLRYDTLIYNYPSARRHIDYQFIYSTPMQLRPKTIGRALLLFPGMTYRPRYIANSYNSLMALRNFKYINIEFTESTASTDSLPLVDANVRLIDATRQRLALSLELTNASPLGNEEEGSNFFYGGNMGVQTGLEYQHKNLFGGAELLKAKGSLLVELPKLAFNSGSAGFYDRFNSMEAGIDLSLDMPIFMLPFSQRFLRVGMRPHTLFNLGGSYQYRYYLERVLANTSFGYTWQHSTRASNQLLPVEMTFVRMISVDDAFMQRINTTGDLRLKYQYSSHFILDARYDYLFSTQVFGRRQNFTSLHLSLESAGAALSLASGAFGSPTDDNGVRYILDVPFAQYLRTNIDLTRYIYLGQRSTLVARLLLGVGLPYGNSVSMPYEKSFFGGGPTTMRAWQLRRLGPGSYSGNDIIDRVGDMQLVLNLEARFPVAGFVEGAAFVDAGNVWLMNASDQYPGGELQLAALGSQMAVGAGLGVRLNFNIAILRLDFALPLLDPAYSAADRWRPASWRMADVVTNFGINYPF